MSWENVLCRELDEHLDMPNTPGIEIVEVDDALLPVWSDVSRRGFFGDRDDEMTRDLTQLMAVVPMRRYLALVDGNPAATGALHMPGSSAFLGGGATMEEFRGRGLQTALIWKRLADASQSCDLAVLHAAVGSASQRNAERAGFRIAYTQASFSVTGSRACRVA